MKLSIAFSLFLLATGTLVAASEKMEQYLNKGIVVEYEDYAGQSHLYYALAYEDGLNDELLSVIQDQSTDLRTLDKGLFALGVIAGSFPEAVTFEDIKSVTEQLERSDHYGEKQLFLLSRAYAAMAFAATDDSLAFLQKRTESDFWKDRDMPSETVVITDPHNESIRTAQSEAFFYIGYHPSERAEDFLINASRNQAIASDEVLSGRIESALIYRDANLNFHAQHMKARSMVLGEPQEVMPDTTPPIPNGSPVLQHEETHAEAISSQASTPVEASAPHESNTQREVNSEKQQDKGENSYLIIVLVLVLCLVVAGILFRKKGK